MTTDIDLLLTTATVEIAAANGSASPRIEILAYSGDVMTVPSFGPLVVDLRDIDLPAEVPLLADHENSIRAIVGQGTPTVRDGKLFVTGTANVTTDAAKQVVGLAKSGHRFQASIGATPLESRRIAAGESVFVNGRTIKATSPFLLVTKSRLREVTICALGCDAATSVSIAAKKELTMTTATTTTTDHNDILAAERERVSGIEAAFEGLELLTLQARASELKSEAICTGWTLDQLQPKLLKLQRDDVQLAQIRASRPRGPMIGGARQDAAGSADHLAAALMVRAGFESAAEKAFGEQVLEQSRRLHAQSLPDLCRAALQIDGRDCPNARDAMIRAALSTGSMPVALGTAANKTLIVSYQTAPASWRSFAAVKPAANFKPQTGIRPTFAGDLEQLGNGGEIKHGTFAEETYSWSVSTYAKMFSISRVDIVNDDVSAFSELIPALGRAAMRTLNGLVATTLLANAGSFFASGHKNYFSGASTNLQASSLATAITMLRQMKNAAGDVLDLQPSALVVPPELEQTAKALVTSATLQRYVASNTDNAPMGNPLVNVAQVVVEPRLSDSDYSGNSATGWYLFSDPLNAGIVVGFLDGNETPTLEQFGLDSDPSSLAYSFRVYHDFGVALADFRAAIKSKGAA